MQVWKKILLVIIGFIFVISLSTATIWFSTKGTLLNANTYRPIITDLGQNIAEGFFGQDLNINSQMKKSFEPVITTWLDNIFDYIKGNTNTLTLTLPPDSVMKSILQSITKEQMKNNTSIQMTDSQINALIESKYPVVKQQLQTQLKDTEKNIQPQLSQIRNTISLLNQIGTIALIVCIILLILIIILICDIRSILNWLGSYLLIAGIPLLIFSLGLITALPTILSNTNAPQEYLTTITKVLSPMFSNLTIISGIIVGLGLLFVFIKYAFPKTTKQ